MWSGPFGYWTTTVVPNAGTLRPRHAECETKTDGLKQRGRSTTLTVKEALMGMPGPVEILLILFILLVLALPVVAVVVLVVVLARKSGKQEEPAPPAPPGE